MSQQTGPMLINLPTPSSNPDTPNDMPPSSFSSGTPTSTTTSLSALSTTAIKDGHRGHAHGFPALGGPRGHHHQSSTNSLEAERADRISRLAGLERVSTLRTPSHHQHPQQQPGNAQSPSPQQTTPTSTTFPSNQLQQNQIGNLPVAPAYFDSNGQPTAATKMSTVGSASATGSVGARTTTEAGEQFDDTTEVDEDVMSMDTNYRTMDADSTSGADAMDEEMASRSVGGFEDRMSDDGTASLVGFGEGANSTVSGPIYHRRPLPGAAGAAGVWGLERSSSGLSEGAMLRSQQMREAANMTASGDVNASASAQAERRDARMMDGVSVDGGGHVGTSDDDVFVDTTTRGPVPMQGGHHGAAGSTSREAAERILRERLDRGETRVGGASSTLGSTGGGGEQLGRFYFEEKK
ncbi:hypothetical protein PGQ11_014857 [Apiospora arundinis]|uniref:Uncharacterized protein n=1 Tax=Apiospora arundinis TaxID=335852 RepID=A0ABR2HJI0_9PEZI